MNTLATPKHKQYQYGIDFIVEGKNIDIGRRGTGYEFFFRNYDGALLGYMKFHIIEVESGMEKKMMHRGYIIDTVSSSAFDKIDENGQKIFHDYGYNPEISLEGFGPTMMSHVLGYMKQTHGDIDMVLVNALKSNEQVMWKLIGKVKDSAGSIIERTAGGNDMHMATLFLKQ